MKPSTVHSLVIGILSVALAAHAQDTKPAPPPGPPDAAKPEIGRAHV